MKSLFMLFAAAFLAGCASSPVPDSQQTQVPVYHQYGFATADADASSTMIVSRDAGFYGGACNAVIFIDSVRAAELAPKEVVTLHVKPGRHVAGVAYSSSVCGSGTARREAETTVESGKVRKYRISTAPDSGLVIQPNTY